MFKKIVISRDNNAVITLGNAKKGCRFDLISIKCIITQEAKPLCKSTKHFINCEFWSEIHNTI